MPITLQPQIKHTIPDAISPKMDKPEVENVQVSDCENCQETTVKSAASCIEFVVGLSNQDCTCIEDGRPDDYNETYSGLYVDNYTDGIPLNAPTPQTCGTGTIWDSLHAMRLEMTEDFVTRLIMAIAENRNKFIDGFEGSFGSVNPKGNAILKKCNGDYAGIIIKPKTYKGLCMYLNEIGLAISKPGIYSIKIYDLDELNKGVENELVSFDVDHVGNNALCWFDIKGGIQLPMYTGNRPKCYVLAYETKGAQPLDYKYWCGCGDGSKPKWMKSGYVESKGFCVNDLTQIEYSNCKTCRLKNTSGLIVNWSYVCDPLVWLCSLPCDFWYKTAWGRIAAKTMQMMLAIKVSYFFTNCNNFTATSLTTIEDHKRKRGKYYGLIDDYFRYLATNMPDNVSHCWHCVGTSFGKSISNR